MRYGGQSYELTIPFGADAIAAFHKAHRRAYGYDRPSARLEIVNLRLRAVGWVPSPQIKAHPLGKTDPSPAQIEARPVMLSSGERQLPFYQGEALQPGNVIDGPAIVVREDTTVLIEAGDRATVDPYLNLMISIALPSP
jgi:N-methylhydantoinase A